jgi:aerobic carbon-monoxide dehydrogenase small subunit
MSEHRIALTVNGRRAEETVPARLTLVDFLRDRLGLTGTHIGCEHGVCGACTIFLDGEPVRSCLMFAVQAEGRELRTVEGLAPADGELGVLQDAFWECHALQCGYCTPGMLMAAHDLLEKNPTPDEADVREAIGGNLCRCTGYQQIVEAVLLAAGRLPPPGVVMRRSTSSLSQITAQMYSRLLAMGGAVNQIRDLLLTFGLDPIIVIALMALIWLVLGMLIDSVSIILLTLPIFAPIALQLGVDPLAFAIFGILMIEAGLLTPPFGLLVYTVKGSVPDRTATLGKIFVGSTPYFLMILAVALLVLSFPGLASWLPRQMF